jgi:hypothetical protein
VSLRIIYPYGMTAARWCSQMAMGLTDYVPQLPKVSNDSEWVPWARSVAGNASMSVYKIPPPDRYRTWRPWASDFIRALSSVGL